MSYALKLIRIYHAYVRKNDKDEAAIVCILFFAKFLEKVDGGKG